MKLWEQTMLLLLSTALPHTFGSILGGTPPWKRQEVSQNACSDSYPCLEKGLLSSSPKQQKKFGNIIFELIVAQRQ